MVEGISRHLKGKGAILSLDLFNAYDRVNFSYLQKVIEAMNIPEVFISRLLMLLQLDISWTSFLILVEGK